MIIQIAILPAELSEVGLIIDDSPFPLQMTPSGISQSSLLWESLMSHDLGNWHSFPNQPSSQMHRPHEQ